MRKVLKASEGHILTNGEVFGRTIYLAEGVDENSFYEITGKEFEIMNQKLLNISETGV